jgi:hypothetical protein
MHSLPKYMGEYRKQLQKGEIQKAYRGLMDYMLSLRNHFQKNHPEYDVQGNIYFGYMDMTYFALFPKPLRKRKLKVAVVFLHEGFRFEAWLSGVNRQIQVDYWNLIQEKKWNKYGIAANPKASDSILEHILVENPDFDDLERLTKEIEDNTIKFIIDIQDFLHEQMEVEK